MNRRIFLSLVAAAALPVAALADEPAVYAPGGVALGGTDPISYHNTGGPQAGSSDHALMWMGATWLFASAENRAQFEMDPYRYAPAFGGYCAYAISRGYTAASDPEAFTIKDGKVYLNYSPRVQDMWAEDMAGNIAAGQANWPAVLE